MADVRELVEALVVVESKVNDDNVEDRVEELEVEDISVVEDVEVEEDEGEELVVELDAIVAISGTPATLCCCPRETPGTL